MSFSQLFRNSKFAALDPLGRQVLTTPVHLRAKGEWGLKSNISRTVNTPFIQVSKQDNENGIPEYKTAFEMVASVERWKELFPLPLNPHALPKLIEREFDVPPNLRSADDVPADVRAVRDTFRPIDLTKASAQEYQQVVDRAWKYRSMFMGLVEKGIYTERQWTHFLKVLSPTNGGVTLSKRQDMKHPPVYRVRKSDERTLPVAGRVLNKLAGSRGGIAIGIAGYVAYLPPSQSGTYFHTLDRDTQFQFNVLANRINSKGQPEIIVGFESNRDSYLSGTASKYDQKMGGGHRSMSNIFSKKLENQFERMHGSGGMNMRRPGGKFNRSLPAEDVEKMLKDKP